MPIPNPAQLNDIPVNLGPGVPPTAIDSEVDRLHNRISWNARGARNLLLVADVDGLGLLINTHPVARDVSTGFFPNQAEWGLINDPISGGFTVGLYFNKSIGGAQVIMEIDPAQIPPIAPTETFAAYGLSQDADIDYWLLDGWERLGQDNPMIMYVRVQAGRPYMLGRVYFCDLTGSLTGSTTERLVPNYDLYISNTTARAIRVVPEYPAAIQIKYVWPSGGYDPTGNPNQTPSEWALRWQQMGDPASYFDFTPFHINPGSDEVLGVGVEKLTLINPIAQPAGEGYFVYVVRRDSGPYDYIDFYIFDYDSSVPGNSTELLRGSVQIPLLGPGSSFSFFGDDESYIDPAGNPCIALTLIQSADYNPNTDPGVVCVFEFAYMNLTTPGVTAVDSSFTVVTPNNAGSVPRKDPETLTVEDTPGVFKVYIFNREHDGNKWVLHRTLAWI